MQPFVARDAHIQGTKAPLAVHTGSRRSADVDELPPMRVPAFTFALNAVLFEQVGSVSRFVSGLPVLRAVPRRSEAFARYFDLPRDP